VTRAVKARARRNQQRQVPARSLHAICELTRLAACGSCRACGPDRPCVQSATEPDGLHVARFTEACRRGLITAADLAAVIRAAGALSAAAIVYDDTLGKIA
jgi:hypothetical protein